MAKNRATYRRTTVPSCSNRGESPKGRRSDHRRDVPVAISTPFDVDRKIVTATVADSDSD